jgi:hypothetical protein
MLKPRRYIHLKCEKCGRSAFFDRKNDPDLPDEVDLIKTDECDKCETSGGFNGEHWFDKSGTEILPE